MPELPVGPRPEASTTRGGRGQAHDAAPAPSPVVDRGSPFIVSPRPQRMRSCPALAPINTTEVGRRWALGVAVLGSTLLMMPPGCAPRLRQAGHLTETPEQRGFVPPGGITGPNGDRIYFHKDLTERLGPPRVWELVIFSEPRAGATEMLSLLEGRCEEGKICIISAGFYDAAGDIILQKENNPPQCSSVGPGTINEGRYRALCR